MLIKCLTRVQVNTNLRPMAETAPRADPSQIHVNAAVVSGFKLIKSNFTRLHFNFSAREIKILKIEPMVKIFGTILDCLLKFFLST